MHPYVCTSILLASVLGRYRLVAFRMTGLSLNQMFASPTPTEHFAGYSSVPLPTLRNPSAPGPSPAPPSRGQSLRRQWSVRSSHPRERYPSYDCLSTTPRDSVSRVKWRAIADRMNPAPPFTMTVLHISLICASLTISDLGTVARRYDVTSC